MSSFSASGERMQSFTCSYGSTPVSGKCEFRFGNGETLVYESLSSGWTPSFAQLCQDVAAFPDTLVQVHEIDAVVRDSANTHIHRFVQECFEWPATTAPFYAKNAPEPLQRLVFAAYRKAGGHKYLDARAVKAWLCMYQTPGLCACMWGGGAQRCRICCE